MGIWEDFTSAVSDTVNSITQEANRAIESFNRTLDDAKRGDAGAFVYKSGKSFVDFGYKPLEATYNFSRGDFEGAKKSFAQGVGAGMNIAGGPSAYVANTSAGQKLLDDKSVDRYSGGLSGDYAGTVRTGYDLENTGTTNQENIDDTLRYGAKVGTIAGGYLLYNEYQAASSVGGSVFEGAGTKAATYGGYAKDASLAYGAGTALARGDVKGAVNQARGISGDYGDYLPELPDGPSWLPDFSEIWDRIAGNDQGSGVKEHSPWDFGGSADSGISAPKVAGVSIATLALIAGAAILIKKGALK